MLTPRDRRYGCSDVGAEAKWLNVKNTAIPTLRVCEGEIEDEICYFMRECAVT